MRMGENLQNLPARPGTARFTRSVPYGHLLMCILLIAIRVPRDTRIACDDDTGINCRRATISFPQPAPCGLRIKLSTLCVSAHLRVTFTIIAADFKIAKLN